MKGWRERLGAHRPELIAEAVCPKRAAVAVILRQGARSPEVLVIHRAEHPDDPWSGHLALPGGRVDATDEDPLAAARRETLEEVAIDLAADAQLLGRLDDLPAIAQGRAVPLVISPFVFSLEREVTPALSHEVQRIHWVELAWLRDPAAATQVRYPHKGQELVLPGWRVEDQVLWGLTYRMLVGLLALLEP
ncbi:MAG: CoA pyrophosphatase [Deltaproteobacteria bacterium]|nr:CoA pyrophosphatase [Deltaproteobacteria bacterium]